MGTGYTTLFRGGLTPAHDVGFPAVVRAAESFAFSSRSCVAAVITGSSGEASWYI
jgi:hypothetical protein